MLNLCRDRKHEDFGGKNRRWRRKLPAFTQKDLEKCCLVQDFCGGAQGTLPSCSVGHCGILIRNLSVMPGDSDENKTGFLWFTGPRSIH